MTSTQSNGFSVEVIAPTQGLPSWVQSLPLWHWHEIPNTALASVDPVPRSIGAPKSKIDAWCGATLKREGSVYLIAAAGGHADYAGNEVDALALNREVPRWEQLRAPSPVEELYNVASFNRDLTPASAHNYSGTQFINARNLLLITPQRALGNPVIPDPPADWPYSNKNMPGYRLSAAFDMAQREWKHPNFIATSPARQGAVGVLCAKHPVTEDIYHSRPGDGWLHWNQADNTWTKLSSISEVYYVGGAIDPVSNRVLVVGSYTGDIGPRVRELDGRLVPVTFGGLGEEPLVAANYPGVVYDEVNRRFVVVHQTASALRVVTVDPATWRVEEPVIGGTPPPLRVNGMHNSAQYVPELGGIVFVMQHRGNARFLRTSMQPSDGVPTR